jgi:MFS family permease
MADRLSSKRRTAVLVTLCLAVFTINLDTTIVNVALPTLVRDLGASTTQLQWVVDAYNLVFAAFVLAAGSVSDRVGRKEALLTGLAIFGTGSLIGSRCTSPGQLIAVRGLIGLGAAIIFPTTLSIISNVFTGRTERAKAIGLLGAMTGVGVAAGPICGGWLLEHFWWGSVFVGLVPVAAAVAALVAWRVPTSRDPKAPRVDRAGLALSTGAIGLLVFTIIEAPVFGWAAGRTVAGFAAAAALLAAFVAWERRADEPMLDVRLFRNLRFTAASGSVTVAVIGSVFASLYASRLILPAGLPADAAKAAGESVGGAFIAAQRIADAGLGPIAAQLKAAAAAAFFDGFSTGCLVAAGVAAVGAIAAALVLPAHPIVVSDDEVDDVGVFDSSSTRTADGVVNVKRAHLGVTSR